MNTKSPTTHTASAAKAETASEGDKRLRILEATIKRNQYRQDALIEILHSAQQLFGYLESGLLYFIARKLKLAPSKVYGVATFYHFFTLKPRGEHTCVICLGTACYVKGADTLIKTAEQAAHVRAGETTADGKLSLLTARCLGACGIAPAVVIDEMVKGHQTSQTLLNELKGWCRNGSP